MKRKIFKLRALTYFFWRGKDGKEAVISKGEIVEGDAAFKKQVVDEEGICEVVK